MKQHMKKILILILILTAFSCQNDSINSDNEQGGVKKCECVAYVKNELNISTPTADAHNWGLTYTPSGYFAVNAPQVGDLIVMTSYYQTNSNVGHIAIVKTVVFINNNYILTIHGANQGGSLIECGCNNVSDWENLMIPSVDITDGKVRFYRKTSYVYKCLQLENSISPPVLISPLNNVTVTNVHLQWQIVANASGYELNIDGNSVIIGNGNQSSYDPVLNYGQHQWKARTREISNSFGIWTPVATFIYQQNTVSETCNGIDDNLDGIIDNLSSCWTTIYRFQDPKTGARCWNNSTSPPNGYQNYLYEIEAWVSPSYQIPNTFELVQCSKQTDHILIEKNSNNYDSLIKAGYQKTANLGYVWTNNGVSHSNTYLARGYTVCKVYRLSYTLSGGSGAHLFTRGADNVANMTCEMPPRFEVITNHTIFSNPPCP